MAELRECGSVSLSHIDDLLTYPFNSIRTGAQRPDFCHIFPTSMLRARCKDAQPPVTTYTKVSGENVLPSSCFPCLQVHISRRRTSTLFFQMASFSRFSRSSRVELPFTLSFSPIFPSFLSVAPYIVSVADY